MKSCEDATAQQRHDQNFIANGTSVWYVCFVLTIIKSPQIKMNETRTRKSKQRMVLVKMAKLRFKRSNNSDAGSDPLSSSFICMEHPVPLSDLTETSVEATEASISRDLVSRVIQLQSYERDPFAVASEEGHSSISEGIFPSQTGGSGVVVVTRLKKSVSWSNVVINYHAVVLGDNPSVSSGPPVALGPELLHRDSLSLLEYEESRPPRREKFQMALPRMIREDMLKDEGYGRADFRKVEEEIRKVKKHRKASGTPSLWTRLRNLSHSKGALMRLKDLDADNRLAI